MRCYCPGPWTHAHSLQRAVEKGMATCVVVIGKTCQEYLLENSGSYRCGLNTQGARGTSIVVNTSLALDPRQARWGVGIDLTRNAHGRGRHWLPPPAFGGARGSPCRKRRV